MSKDWNFAVIGAGGRGHLARHAHNPKNNCYLKAGMDTDPAAFEQFKTWADKVGHKDYYLTEDYDQILDDASIDAVFISTPDFYHEDMAIDALKKGKAVYLEKPIAITIEGADRVLKAARENNGKLYVGHNMRHMNWVVKMKELIEDGAIGELQSVWCRHFINYGGDAYFKDWHSEIKNATSLLLQKGAHDIDVIHWLSNSYTNKVTAMGKLSVYDKCHRRKETDAWDTSWQPDNWPPLEQKNFSPVIDVEDHNMVLMQLENGVQACYLQSHYAPDSCRNYTFIGTNGRIENFDGDGLVRIEVKNRRNKHFMDEPDIVFNLKPELGGHGGGDLKIVNEFIEYVKEDKSPTTSPIGARNAVAVGVKAAECLRGSFGFGEIPALSDDIIKYFDEQ